MNRKTLDNIDKKVGQALRAVDKLPARKPTLKAIVERHRAEIQRRRDAGHNYKVIAKYLATKGIDIAGNTLKQYMAKPQALKVATPPGVAVARLSIPAVINLTPDEDEM